MSEMPPPRAVGEPPAAAEITEEIDRTRKELEETVEALVGKFDVAARARHMSANARQRIRGTSSGAASFLGALGEQVRDTAPQDASQLAARARRSAERNPVAWGAAAGALAALVLGLALRRRWW